MIRKAGGSLKHTVQEYLKRLPAEKMKSLLQECLQEEAQHRYGIVFPDLLQALLERTERGEPSLPPQTRALLAKRLWDFYSQDKGCEYNN